MYNLLISTLTSGHPQFEDYSCALHPLEPLSAAEVERAVALLRTLPEFTPPTRVISVMLKEPAKDVVHGWPDIEAPDREAEAVLHDNARNACFHLDLNLTTGCVTPPRYAPPGSQPTMSIDEQVECEQAVLASEEFRAASQASSTASKTRRS